LRDGLREPLPSAEEMAQMDRVTIEGGISASELMERAGRGVFNYLTKNFQTKLKNAVILCGPGNNGGDGLVVARMLKEAGHEPVAVVASSSKYSSGCVEQLHKAVQAGVVPFITSTEAGPKEIQLTLINNQNLANAFGQCQILLDCLLGTGQHSGPRGDIADLLNVSAAYQVTRVAIDVPTGVDCSSGALYEPYFKADLTLSIECIKRGLLQYPAQSACGELVKIPIGIKSDGLTEFCLSSSGDLEFPSRAPNFHKGLAGAVYVLGGCLSMPGAPILASHAALRAGAGLVRMATLGARQSANVWPEVILDPHNGDYFEESHFAALRDSFKESNVIVLGPGLGTRPETAKLVKRILVFTKDNEIPVVVDADALNMLANVKSGFELGHCVLTPHPAEASRLLTSDTSEVQTDRYSAALQLQQRYKGVVVLKGASTLIRGPNEGFVNLTGNSSMATAGSGDVLSGILAAFMAQFGKTRGTMYATRLAVFVHGRAGEIASRDGACPIIASDITNAIPQAIIDLN